MSGIFSRAVEGQSLRVPAQAYNAAMDAAEHFATRGRPTGGGGIKGARGVHQLTADIRNDTGAQIAAGECVMLQELSGASAGLNGGIYEVNASPLLLGVYKTETTTTQFHQPFGIALEPIPDGETGKVCIEGVCVATIGDGGSDGTGYAVPFFTSSGASLYFTSRRGPVRILQPMSGSQYLVYVGDCVWQTRRNLTPTGTSATYVVGDARGTAAIGSANSDGFVLSSETLTSTYSSVIPTSVIKLPSAGMYDFRYEIAAHVVVNSGSGPARTLKTSNAAITTLTMSRFAVRLELVVLDNSNAVVSYTNWPQLTGTTATRGAEIISIPMMASSYEGFDYHKYCGGSVTLDTRFFLTGYTKVGVRMSVSDWPTGDAAFVNSEFVPVITLRGTGYVQPAIADIYLDPT